MPYPPAVEYKYMASAHDGVYNAAVRLKIVRRPANARGEGKNIPPFP
jgi:hypothetical protein